MSDEGLMINLMGRWQQVYEAAVQLCLSRGELAAAFDYAERARARAFADMLARRGAGLAQDRATPLTARETQAALPEGTLLLAYFAIGLRGPESAMLDAIPSDAAGLRACLTTKPQLLLLALTRDGLRAHDCPLNPNALQASSVYQADGRRFLARQVLRKANDALVAPVADLIGQAARVVVVPHGPLHQLPFAALLDAEGRPLLERSPHLAYAPSATVLLRALATHRTAPEQPCLALGYDGAVGQRLRYTEPEAAAVAQIAGGVAWRGAAGTCQELTQAAGDYRWLHLACHGEFDLDDPLRSWLEIGPEERLSAADVIANFRLRADLVTLSACRSGVSKVLRGDEPMGLVRAFLTAGARAVLVTLWPVEDTSARLLMERFYAALLEQGAASEPAQALVVAQRYLRDLTIAQVQAQLASWGEDASDAEVDEGVRPYADPAFWAAYALIGGVAPVSTAI
jgi:CHAT domain-containing protein